MALSDSHRDALFLGPQALAEFQPGSSWEADPMGPPRQGTTAPPSVQPPYTPPPATVAAASIHPHHAPPVSTTAPPAEFPDHPAPRPTMAAPSVQPDYPPPRPTVAAAAVHPRHVSPPATVATPSVQPDYPLPRSTVAPPAATPDYAPPRSTVAASAEFPDYPAPRATVAPPAIFPDPPAPRPTRAAPSRHLDYPGPRFWAPRPILRRLSGGAHSHGFIQASAPLAGVQDALSVWQQHLQVVGGQVLVLPIEICQWLIVHQSGRWSQLTVAPQDVSVGQDPVSGLDTIDVPTGNCWGVKSNGQVYFTPDGDMGQDESASLVVSGSQVLLIR